MENYLNGLPAIQKSQIQELVIKLIENYKPERIYCFGYNQQCTTIRGCFAALDQDANDFHYYFLMVTTNKNRIEHEVQEFVNRNFSYGTISIVVHGMETISDAICQGNRFFTTVFREGILVYSIDGMHPDIALPKLNPARLLAKTETFYQYRFNMAKGFLEAAACSFDNGFYNNTTFLLHQAMEQACMTLIKVYTAYRSDMHNIGRLLNFCGCFSNEPSGVFTHEKDEDNRLFQILNRSYSESRYKDDFKVNQEDAKGLYLKVKEFFDLTEKLCTIKIITYRKEANDAGNSLINCISAQPASL